MVPPICLLLLLLRNNKLVCPTSEETLYFSTKIEMKKNSILLLIIWAPVLTNSFLVIVNETPAYKFSVQHLPCKFRLVGKKRFVVDFFLSNIAT